MGWLHTSWVGKKLWKSPSSQLLLLLLHPFPVAHFYQAELCYLGSPCLRCCLRCLTDTAGWEVAWGVACSTGVSIPTHTSSLGLQPPHPVRSTFPLPLPEQYQPVFRLHVLATLTCPPALGTAAHLRDFAQAFYSAWALPGEP